MINFGVTLVYMFLAMRRIREQKAQSIPYAYQQPYQQGMYQQGGYGQDPYQQNSYNQDYQGQNGYSGQMGGRENGRNDFGEH